jgi:hypothetical protein
MSNWELLDFNRHTGVKTYLGDNPDDPEGVLVRHEFSRNYTNAILDINKIEANHHNTGRMGDMERAARIPIEVMYEWKIKFGVDAWRYAADPDVRKRVNRLLNSSDYRYLKCRDIIL